MSEIVKKLIFPAYTDSGANDAFVEQDDLRSEATTQVHDNRSLKNNNNSNKMKMRSSSSLSPRSADRASTFSQTSKRPSPNAMNENIRLHSSSSLSPRPRQIQQHSPHPPTSGGNNNNNSKSLLFPSTRPTAIKNSTRTVSTTAHVGSSLSFASPTENSTIPSPSSPPQEDENNESPHKKNENQSSLTISTFHEREPTSASSTLVGQKFVSSDAGTSTCQSEPEEETQQERTEDSISEVLSTASEMGTVINISTRLADVDAMALAALAQTPSDAGIQNDNNEEDNVVAESLSLPVLEEDEEEKKKDSLTTKITSNMEAEEETIFHHNTSSRHYHRSRKDTGIRSAPTTPRPSVQDYLKSAYRSNNNNDHEPKINTNADVSTIATSLLQSPGSNHYYQSNILTPLLSPRFGLRMRTHSMDRLKQGELSLASPLRFARGSFSFDNGSDVNKNNKNELEQDVDNRNTRFSSSKRFSRNNSVEKDLGNNHDGPAMPSDAQIIKSLQQEQQQSNNEDDRVALEPKSSFILQSKSWDGAKIAKKTPQSAFRDSSFDTRVLHWHISQQIQQKQQQKQQQQQRDYSPTVASSAPEDSMALRTPHRVEIERDDALDILACLVQQGAEFEGGISKQIEDQQGADEKKTEGEIDQSSRDVVAHRDDVDADGVSTAAYIEEREQENNSRGGVEIPSPAKIKRKPLVAESPRDNGNKDALPAELLEAIQSLRQVSQEHAGSDADQKSIHLNRMKALDELLRSHTYAGEMRRASRSASTWLRSIRRSDATSSVGGTIMEGNEESSSSSSSSSRETSRNKDKNNNNNPATNQSAGEEEEVNGLAKKMDVLALKAMIHSSELKVKEKEEEARRLNQELSICRAEIGRLKSASRAETLFKSSNRSILDRSVDSDDSSDEEAVSQTNADVVNPMDISNASSIPLTGAENDIVVDASFCKSEVASTAKDWGALADAKREAILLKAALAEANETIRKLHAEKNESEHASVPTVGTADIDLGREMDEYREIVRKDLLAEASNSTVNREQLERENFVTEWAELAQPLPPPPDHDLRSPIVDALLAQWTNDGNMQGSLLSWMERVMSGADPESVPQLTITSLDHQVRDGLIMHVLPLLLRRADLKVDVKSRTHRSTSHDMSVSVTRDFKLEQIQSNIETPVAKTHSMAYKASKNGGAMLDDTLANDEERQDGSAPAHVGDYRTRNAPSEIGGASSATTAIITNASKIRSSLLREPFDAFASGDEASVGSSTVNSQRGTQSGGFISALGNTFGGILGRSRKQQHQHQQSSFFPADDARQVSALINHQPLVMHGGGDDAHPYHRVVSAPPGRIGVTFVQYRGHAMVSDVASESPLSGWVFPSDILIAIDEVPVSGMRVRDIVKLLTGRKDRQRALRVISSHAMNEFTLSQSITEEIS